MKRILLFCLALGALKAQAQTTLYVDSSVTASGTGTSWATAYKTLNEALNIANAASITTDYVINVARGTYYPTGAQGSTNRDSTFAMLRGGLRVYGGFPTGGGARDAAANPTVLSGAIGSVNDSTDNSYHIMVIAGIADASDSSMVDGLIFTGGQATGSGSRTFATQSVSRSYGGGICAQGIPAQVGISNCRFLTNVGIEGGAIANASKASPTISYCTFSGNNAPTNLGYGAALYNGGGCNASVLDCTFSGNTAHEGGAMYDLYGTPSSTINVQYCTFTGNTAALGGGILNAGITASSFTLANSSFSGNTAQSGGAFYDDTQTGAVYGIVNCTFTGNKATGTSQGGGGAIYVDHTNTYLYEINDCSFTGNTSVLDGGAIHATGNGSINNCRFTADTSLSGSGGAISAARTVSNCVFMLNRASVDGGAVTSGNLQLKNSAFRGNTATGNGGGISLLVSGSVSAYLQGCLFSGNKAGNGGGMYIAGTPNSSNMYVRIVASTFAGDTAVNGNAIYNTSISPQISDGIIWDGMTNGIFNFNNSFPAISYSMVQGGYSGTGNLDSDPLFVGPVAATQAPDTTGDYHLLPCSPAINSGNNFVLDPLGYYITQGQDLDGNMRLYDATIDRGVYEHQQAVVTAGPITGNATVCLNGTAQMGNATTGGSWSSSNPAVATISSTGLVTGMALGADTITYSYTNANNCSSFSTMVITVVGLPVAAPISGVDSLCKGTSTLFADATTGGTWSSSNPAIATISSTGSIAALTAGTDTITYTVTNSNGCVTKVSKTLTVNPLPVIGPITNNVPICTGTSVALSDATPGGIWNTSTANLVAVDSLTGVVTGISAGTAPITYKVTDTNGCMASTSALVTVNAPLYVSSVIGDTVVCAGSDLLLYSATIGGTWSSSNPAVATVSNTGQVTGIAADTATIFYSVTSGGGCTSTVYKKIRVQEQPAVTAIVGPADVCANSTAQYSDAAPGGVWISLDPTIATVSNNGLVTTGPTAGTVVIAYKVTNAGNCSNMATDTITVYPVAASNISAAICAGSSYPFGGQTLTAAGIYTHVFQSASGCDSTVTLSLSLTTINVLVTQNDAQLKANQPGAAYQWLDCSNGDAPIPGATGQTFTATANGQYAVAVTWNGCTDTSACRTVSNIAVAAVTGAFPSLQVYPNPTPGWITVATGREIARCISVMDISGKQLLRIIPDQGTSRIDLSGFAAGVYLVEVSDGVRKQTVRVNRMN